MEKKVTSIQDLIDLVNNLAIKNRKENGTYNITLANLAGILAIELERINLFFEEQGLIGFDQWELISTKTIQSELDNIHQAINLNELINPKNSNQN